MAWTYGEYLAEDWLEATTDSTSTEYVSELYVTSASSTDAKRIKRIYANDNENNATIVWDIWDYWLEANDFDIPSIGGYVRDYIEVDSFGTDVEGENHNISYSFSPSTIAKNTSDNEIEHRIKVTQYGSGDYLYVYAMQSKRIAADVIYGTPTVEDAYIEVAPAGGGTVYLLVNWKQSVTILYDNDTTEEDGYVYGSSEATVLTLGNKVVTGCSIDGGGVYVPSAGSLVDSAEQKYCCNITKYSFEANGVTATKSSQTIPVNREKNTATTEYNVWVGSPSVSSVSASESSFTVSATCEERKVFTSGTIGGWTNSSANVTKSSDISSVSPTTFTGSATITVTVKENYFGARNPYIIVKSSGDSSIAKTVQVVQNAASFEFDSYSLPASIPYEGGTISLSVISRVNGKACPLTSVTSSLSGITISNPVLTDSRGEYTFSVTAGKNTTGAIRTFKITAVQQYSADSVEWSVSQEKEAAVVKPKVGVVANASFEDANYDNVTYSIYFDATNTSKYEGGTIKNVYVELNTKMDGTGTAISSILLGTSINIASGTKSQTYTGSLFNRNQSNLVYFIVRFDNAVQYKSLIMQSPT